MIRRKSSLSDLTEALTRTALRHAFEDADKDSSGFVCRQELMGVLETIGVEMQNPTDDMEALFEAMDIDGDGTIDVSEFISKFEPAIKRGGSTIMAKMDLATVMKETFDAMLGEERDQRTAVNRSFMQAREDCRAFFEKMFLGSKWRMKMFEEFYTNGGKGCASRLAHLRASLASATLGTNTWVAEALDSDADFKKEVLDKEGIQAFANKWRVRLEAEMAGISAKRLASSETNLGRTGDEPEGLTRSVSFVSADGTRTSSHFDDLEKTSSLSLPDSFERLRAVA